MFKLFNFRSFFKGRRLILFFAGLFAVSLFLAGCGDGGSNRPEEEIFQSSDEHLTKSLSFDPSNPISVTFSPQSELEGYLDNLISVIDNSQTSLDIALYGFDSDETYSALKRATARGVQIRILKSVF